MTASATLDAKAAPIVSSYAYGRSADFTFNDVRTDLEPVAKVAGQAPPAYDQAGGVPNLDETVALQPGSSINPYLHITAENVATRAESGGVAVDFITAHGGANTGSVNLVLSDNPRPPGVLGVLGLFVNATGIHSDANFSILFGANRNFAAGSASFGSLTLGGALIGNTLTFSGDAAPNTILFSSASVTVMLDKQLIPEFVSCSLTCRTTPVGITTDAIDISLHNGGLFGRNRVRRHHRRRVVLRTGGRRSAGPRTCRPGPVRIWPSQFA
ncbi:MAG: hypothetical protein JOY71_31755 [Acetobacteraceae bacterium]|nr:hypothetical protein [Acetobacteraceae bacterium]